MNPDTDTPTTRIRPPVRPVPVTGGGEPALGSANYHLGREVARGGMGCILEAEDRKLARTVAAKAVMLDSDMDEATKQRFIREAEVLAQLAHPNIVPIHDIVWEGGVPLFYTMKLVKGRTLQAILKDLRHQNSGVLREYTLDRLLAIFRKVCDAIAFAHSKGVLHRDLKPENIMVGEFGEVLVMDWGLAKMLDDECRMTNARAPEPAAPDSSSGIRDSSFSGTLSGALLGTPQYMSPEQAAGETNLLDERSDVYSLGAILYAILTLRPPVAGKSVEELLEKVKTGSITPPTSYGTTKSEAVAPKKNGVAEAKKLQPPPHLPSGRVPPALSAVAMKALTLDKTKRYQDVAALSAEIERYQSGFATTAEHAGTLKQLGLLMLRHKAVTALLGVMVLLSIGFVARLVASEKRAIAGEQSAVAEAARASQAEAVAIQEKQATVSALARSALSLAEAALREGNGSMMQAALGDVPEDLRDSTWHYLRGQSDSSIARIDTGTDIDDVVAHPKLPSVFVVVDHDGIVTLLNVRTGKRLLEFSTGSEFPAIRFKAYRIAISPDGERIAVGRWQVRSDHVGITIHDARNGKPLRQWDAARTVALAFGPDGKSLAQAAVDSEGARTIKFWDVESGRLQWTYAELVGEGRNLTMNLAPGGQQLWVQSRGGAVLLSLNDGSVVRSVRLLNTWALVLRPDGQVLVTGDARGAVKGYDPTDQHIVFEFRTDNRPIEHILFTANGSRLVTIAKLDDGRQALRIWDATTGAPVQSLLGGSGDVTGACLHPLTGELVVTGPETRAWSLGMARWVLRGVREAGVAFWGEDDLGFFPDGRKAATLQRLGSATPNSLWSASLADYFSISLSADGRFATVGTKRRNDPLLLLHKDGMNVKASEIPDVPWRESHRLCPTGKRVAIVWHNFEKAEVKDTATGVSLPRLNGGNFIRFGDVGWLNDERLAGLVTAHAPRGEKGSEEQIVVWDITTGEALYRKTNPGQMDLLAVSPDARRIAEAGADKKVRIRDAATLEVLNEFRAHDGPITALAWHPKKPILATGSTDLTIRLWNLDTGKRIDELRGPLAAPHTLAFAPSGQRLGCASLDATTRIWDPPSLADTEAAK